MHQLKQQHFNFKTNDDSERTAMWEDSSFSFLKPGCLDEHLHLAVFCSKSTFCCHFCCSLLAACAHMADSHLETSQYPLLFEITSQFDANLVSLDVIWNKMSVILNAEIYSTWPCFSVTWGLVFTPTYWASSAVRRMWSPWRLFDLKGKRLLINTKLKISCLVEIYKPVARHKACVLWCNHWHSVKAGLTTTQCSFYWKLDHFFYHYENACSIFVSG